MGCWLSALCRARLCPACAQRPTVKTHEPEALLLCDYELLSLLEPHKQLQNSVTLLRKRVAGQSEPIYSTYP